MTRVSEIKRIDIDVACFQALGTPTNLAAVAVSSSEIDLSWTDNTNGAATAYEIYRGTTSGNTSLVATTENLNSFSDTGLDNGITYYYQVKALQNETFSFLSNEANATTFFDFLNGLEADGVNDWVNISNISGVAIPNQFTGVLWARIPAPPNIQDVLIEQWDNVGNTDFIQLSLSAPVTIDGDSYSLPVLLVTTTSGNEVLTFSPFSGGNTSQRFLCDGTRRDLVVFVVDSANSELKLSMNGSPYRTLSLSNPVSPSQFTSLNLYAGRSGTQRWTNALFGDFVILDREVSEAEITHLYNGGNGTAFGDNNIADAIAYWKFDESSGTNVSDESANNRFGTQNNFTPVDGDKWKVF